jgi:sec-independent protein translocase protein TatB
LARNVGKIMGEFKRATGDLRSTFEGHLRDLEREADQRKTTTPSASSPAASPAPEAPPEPSPVPATPGTVSTTPSHLLGIGTPVSEPSISQTPQNGTAPENLPSEAAQKSPTLDPDHNPETLTDAGTRPA